MLVVFFVTLNGKGFLLKTMKLMMHFSLSLIVLSMLFACSSTKKITDKKQSKPVVLSSGTFLIAEIAKDTTYAYTEDNPVKVGGASDNEGPLNERRYLASIAGPEGQELIFERVGSCCHFKTPNGVLGGGLLDRYQLTWEGGTDTLYIYINMYDPGYLMAPAGLTIKK